MKILLILLLIFALILAYTSYNLYKKVTFYEDKFGDIQFNIQQTIQTMRAIDLNGAFESNDEVGQVFDQMKNMVYLLEELFYEEKKE